MKEIKFRAWDKQTKTMRLVKSINYADDGSAKTIMVHLVGGISFGYVHGESCELLQYTGLKDKNGKEIYEGDIIHFKTYQGGGFGCPIGTDVYHSIVFAEHNTDNNTITEYVGYWAESVRGHLSSIAYTLDHGAIVIGNIYANPELLEETP